MEINILDINGKDTGRKAKLNDSIFLFEPNDHAIYLDVKQGTIKHNNLAALCIVLIPLITCS